MWISKNSTPPFFFFFNLEHTQEIQSKLIKSWELNLKKNSFCTSVLLFPQWSSQSHAPKPSPASHPMWKLWVNWHLCCPAQLWLGELQVLQDGLLWQLRAPSQRPGIFWATEGLQSVGRDKLLGSYPHNHHSDKSVCCCSSASYFAWQVWYQSQLEK